MGYKIKITDTVMECFLLFSMLTILQNFSIFFHINKIWMSISLFLLVYSVLKNKMRLKFIILLLFAFILHIIAIYYSDGYFYHFNMIFYFAIWILFYLFCILNKKRIISFIENKRKFNNMLIYSWCIIVSISVFIPSCYSIEWGGDKYFNSFAGSVFRLMPTALIITSLIINYYLETKRKIYLLLLLIPTYSAFMGGSRTYFGIYILFILLFVYLIFNSKKKFFLSLAPLIVIFLFLISISGIGNKIEATQYTSKSYFDYWGTITNGRSIFWGWDLEAFFKLPIWQQFIGNGFNFVYEVNGSHNVFLWAHNDFINLLMNFGYIGLFIYFYIFIQMYKVYIPKRTPFLVRFLFLSGVFINSMFNMSYTYLCATISYPLFLIIINKKYSKNF